MIDERPVAVVERKTLENFLKDVSTIRTMHQQLADLSGHRYAAMLIEAQYADLGNPKKIGRWPSAHLLRVVAELGALHPTVPVLFAGNRKLANVWTQRWFAAVAAARKLPEASVVHEAPTLFHLASGTGGIQTQVRLAVLKELPATFSIAELRNKFPDIPTTASAASSQAFARKASSAAPAAARPRAGIVAWGRRGRDGEEASAVPTLRRITSDMRSPTTFWFTTFRPERYSIPHIPDCENCRLHSPPALPNVHNRAFLRSSSTCLVALIPLVC